MEPAENLSDFVTIKAYRASLQGQPGELCALPFRAPNGRQNAFLFCPDDGAISRLLMADVGTFPSSVQVSDHRAQSRTRESVAIALVSDIGRYNGEAGYAKRVSALRWVLNNL